MTEVFYPNELAKDQLKVELISPLAKRDYSKFRPTHSRKRKQHRNGQYGDRVIDINLEVTSEIDGMNNR